LDGGQTQQRAHGRLDDAGAAGTADYRPIWFGRASRFDGGRRFAGVTDAIAIRIHLVRVGRAGAVVLAVRNTVTIGIRVRDATPANARRCLA
jgi:hypothetical protein